MSLSFYHVPRSTSNITSAILDELEYGLPEPLAKRIELSIKAGDTRSPDYLSTVNPNGRVPAIVHDGVAIWESAAITIYLAETFGTAGSSAHRKEALYPALGPQRGEAMKWIVWANVTFAEALSRLRATLPVDPAGGVEEGSQDVEPGKAEGGPGAKAKKDIAKFLDVLNGGLHGRDFLLGKEYCLADTHVWTLVAYVSIMGVSLDGHADIKSWMARVGGRPALKNA